MIEPLHLTAEAYSETWQTSGMECFTEIVNTS